MKPSTALNKNREQIKKIVARYNASNVRVFGSVLSGNDTDTSDLDLLVDVTPETTLMDIGAIRYELKKLLGVEVDVLTPNSLPERAKAQILNMARQV